MYWGEGVESCRCVLATMAACDYNGDGLIKKFFFKLTIAHSRETNRVVYRPSL